jgi:hypothetical protein
VRNGLVLDFETPQAAASGTPGLILFGRHEYWISFSKYVEPAKSARKKCKAGGGAAGPSRSQAPARACALKKTMSHGTW